MEDIRTKQLKNRGKMITKSFDFYKINSDKIAEKLELSRDQLDLAFGIVATVTMDMMEF